MRYSFYHKHISNVHIFYELHQDIKNKYADRIQNIVFLNFNK